jgi:hypothetical protein
MRIKKAHVVAVNAAEGSNEDGDGLGEQEQSGRSDIRGPNDQDGYINHSYD